VEDESSKGGAEGNKAEGEDEEDWF